MKKFGTVVISIVMFFSILSFTALFSLRNVFSKNGISEILEVGFEDIEIDSLVDDIFNSNEDTKELGEYVDKNEFKNAFTDYVAEYFVYAFSENNKQPSSEKLKEILSQSLEKYEKDNNVALDDNVIDEVFDTFDKEMEESKTEITADNDVRVIFDFVYGNYYLVALGISIVCLILIFIINMSIKPVFTSLGIVSIISGVFAFLISLGLKVMLETEEEIKALANAVSSPFKIVAIISIVLGIVLLIVKTYIKDNKKEEIL